VLGTPPALILSQDQTLVSFTDFACPGPALLLLLRICRFVFHASKISLIQEPSIYNSLSPFVKKNRETFSKIWKGEIFVARIHKKGYQTS
jgi:hypothetical protein